MDLPTTVGRPPTDISLTPSQRKSHTFTHWKIPVSFQGRSASNTQALFAKSYFSTCEKLLRLIWKTFWESYFVDHKSLPSSVVGHPSGNINHVVDCLQTSINNTLKLSNGWYLNLHCRLGNIGFCFQWILWGLLQYQAGVIHTRQPHFCQLPAHNS